MWKLQMNVSCIEKGSCFNAPWKDSQWKSRRARHEYFMMVFETDYWFRSMQLISWKHPWQITRESCTILAHTWQHSGLESYSTLSGQFRWLIALNVIIAFNHGRCYRGKSENVHQLSSCIINWLRIPRQI